MNEGLLLNPTEWHNLCYSQAYREAIRKAHPDKGGSDELFNKVQTAFEVLSDPQKRAVYDAWAKELQYRYIPGVASKVGVSAAVNPTAS
jgi:curved DNA-binding protein CbpA